METALKLIVAKSPAAAGEAIRTLQALRNNSPVVQIRYQNAVQMALVDPQAEFTPEERAILADALAVEPAQARDQIIHVRVSAAERQQLENEAGGQSISEYIRSRLFG